MRLRRLALLIPLLAACSPAARADTQCSEAGGPFRLPAELDESSGVAWSRVHPGMLWTHNDGDAGALFAIDQTGRPLGKVTVRSDGRRQDWEDLSIGPCAAGHCVYIANIGDNEAEREWVEVLRLPEPEPTATERLRPDVLRMRYPDGPRDAEALFVVPGAGAGDDPQLFILTKGRNSGAALYRHPGPLSPDTLVTLVEVQTLSAESRMLPRQITGADASPDGRLVAVRTYETLTFHRLTETGLVDTDVGPVNLRTLREPQGEAVALGPDGMVALTSEAGPARAPGVLTLLRCRVPES